MGSPASPKMASSRVSGNAHLLISMQVPPTRFHGDVQNPARLPSSVASSVIASDQRYGNIDPLCIDYALRPRLSSRLTLGGLAFPRKPWACGGWVSRPALATHASILASVPSTDARAAASHGTEGSPTTDKISPPLRCIA